MDRPAYPWDGAEPGLAELHFQQLLTILHRRRRVIIATAVIGTTLALFGSLMIPPQYTAKAQIVFETHALYPSDGRPVVGQPEEEAAFQTHMTALTSRAHLERVLDSLSRDPDFGAAASQAPSGAQWIGDVLWLEFGARLRDWAARLVASRKPQGQSPTDSEALSLDSFEPRLNVYQERGSHVIAVAFRSTSPGQAALTANRLAQLHVESEEERKRAQANRVISWLDERIPEVKGELERAESALQNYRITHGLADPNRTDLSDQKLADLTRQLTAAESDYAKRQAKLASVRDRQRRGSGNDALVDNLESPARAELLRREVALVQSQAEVAAMLDEKHPKALQLAAELQEVRRKLSHEADRAIDDLTNEVRIAGDQVHSIRERIAGLQTASGQAREAEPRLRELGREAAAAGQVYEGLVQRREQLRTQQEATLPDLRILSLASPPNRPSSPSPLLFILPAVIVFSIGGCLLAVAAERLDRGLRSAQDVNDALGIPCIGFVPLIRRRGKARPHEYLLENPFATYAEAIRSLVAALQLAAPEVAPKVILISSSVPKEGKTTLAVSFAVYAALIGRRVLLVDLDFRHPAVSRELGGQAETGVLDALLLDDRSAAAAVQHVPGLDLDYLPVRGRPGDPLLPFVGGHVPRLLRQLRDSYDCVVIDSPPLLAVAEARLLAAMADKVLLVVKWGSTRRDVARDASNLLRDPGLLGQNCCELVGAVLTQVDLKKHAQYRYGGWESVRAIGGPTSRTPKQRDKATSVGAGDAASLKGVDTFGEQPPAHVAAKLLPTRRPHRSLPAWGLLCLVCLAVGGILVGTGDSLLSLVQHTKQRIAAFATLDFGTWVKPFRDNAFPAIAGSPLPAEAIAPPAAAAQETPPALVPPISEQRAGEESEPPASFAAVETPKRVAADASSTEEPAPPQPHPTTIAPARGPVLKQLTSTPAAAAAAPSVEPPTPAPTAPRPAVALTEQRLSGAEIAALVARGDAFVGARDIASARLFYQRAVEAGDEGAALRMGATFDPAFLDRTNIRGASGNQQEAVSWYRHARDLGEAKAERQLKKFPTQ
jgi:succinoglycan biosynthesis transport protein ExoP